MVQYRFPLLAPCALRSVVVVSLCSAARGQNTVVSGRVTDTSGGVIPNAAVELSNLTTQTTLHTIIGAPAGRAGGPRTVDNGQYFNPAELARTPQFQFGNLNRYLPVVRYPSNFGLNALSEKQLTVYERFKAEFRTELLNATNSVNSGRPQTSIASRAFGTIALTGVNNPRAIQFRLRVLP